MTKEPDDTLDEIDSPEADAEVPSPGTIEDKYQAQMRQIMTQKIELPMSAIQGMLDPKAGQIDLSPDFQRRDIWDDARRSRFIESIIMNIPLPPIFLGEVSYGEWVVLDGRQRLTAIYEFLRGSYKLKGLKVWKELNDKNFSKLEDDGQDQYLMRRFVPAVTVNKESSPQVKYDVFDRLNTGGVVATPMEIRNAVYPGPFNKALRSLSNSPDFVFLWNIPVDADLKNDNLIYNRMYDLEQVLRFFAVPEYQGKLRFKDFLGDFMNERNDLYSKNPELAATDQVTFEQTHQIARRIFGAKAFLRAIPDGGHSRQKSAPLADAVLSALVNVPPDAITDDSAARIREAIDQLSLSNDDFKRATTRGTNGKGAIDLRLKLAREAVKNAL